MIKCCFLVFLLPAYSVVLMVSSEIKPNEHVRHTHIARMRTLTLVKNLPSRKKRGASVCAFESKTCEAHRNLCFQGSEKVRVRLLTKAINLRFALSVINQIKRNYSLRAFACGITLLQFACWQHTHTHTHACNILSA